MDFLQLLERASWIWCKNDGIDKNLCAVFRKEFEIKDDSPAELLISADWDYELQVNGSAIGGGQFSDYPDRKTVTAYPVRNLRRGKNVIAVMVYAPGADFFAMLKGVPGLLAVLHRNGEILVASDTDWKARLAPDFQNGLADFVTCQLGFVMCRDLRKTESFAELEYDDSAWPAAVPAPRKCTLAMRPLPPVVSDARLASRLVHAGFLLRKAEDATFAETVANDGYDVSPETANGRYFVFDMGAEVTGYAELELEKLPDGTIIDLSWGESLTEGRVRSRIGARNFTVRFLSGNGQTIFRMPFLRMGCRYLQLNILTPSVQPEQLRYAGLRNCMLELPRAARYESAIAYAPRLREIGLRTLQCCMHNHYEDCPWREQGLYGYDSRNQMLFGYYAWGNYDFARASLDLLGEGCSESTGEINICAPTNYPTAPDGVGTIPAFSRVWMRAMQEYALYSGDLSLAQKFVPQLEKMLERYCRDFDENYGLFRLPEAPGVWNFFEWVPELSYPTRKECDFHILHNLYTLDGIRAAAQCFAWCGKRELARKWDAFANRFGKSIAERFYQESTGVYASMLKNGAAIGKVHAHVQFLMLALDLVPKTRGPELGKKILSDPALVQFSFSPLLYFLEGMFAASPECRSQAAAWIDEAFLAMADSGASTFWETTEGEYDFDHAGSLCHGWSCIHVGYYGKYTLGVTPLEPGFRRFEVKPWPGNCGFASGEIPTPQGMIEVAWKRTANGNLKLEVTSPTGLTPVVASYPEAPVADFVLRTR